MGIGDVFKRLFKKQGEHLSWFRLEDNRVVGGHAPPYDIGIDQAYYVVRMKEMYLKDSRKLWRKYYPMLHGYVTHQEIEEHEVAGPGQLKELGDANLDRMVNINYRIAGPTPYRGEGVDLLVGLYSVPGQDVAKALINTVSTIAGLGGVALGQAKEIADAVKQGVEDILGLDESRLELGIRDTFYPGQDNPLRAGYHVGIARRVQDVGRASLWLKEGRLISGTDAFSGSAYEQDDYMVLQIERRERRDDWPTLPEISEHQERFSGILKDVSLSTAEKKIRITSVWPAFTASVRESMNLITADKERIALSVKRHVNDVINAAGGPFEARVWGGATENIRSVSGFDFLDVPDRFDPTEPAQVQEARNALAGDF